MIIAVKCVAHMEEIQQQVYADTTFKAFNFNLLFVENLKEVICLEEEGTMFVK